MKKVSQSLIWRCRLSVAKQRMLFALFCAGATARASARAAGVNRNTSARLFRVFRVVIAFSRISLSPFSGRVEIDECYIFGAPGGRKVARQGRCLAGKFAVAGIAQRCPETGTRRLKTAVLPAVNRETLHAFARAHVLPGAEINTDQFKAYDLARCGFRHKRVNHSLVFKDFHNGACTNIIESAWSVLRRHFSRFCGGYRHNLRLWLAEVEMRFECGVNGFEKSLKKLLKNACVPGVVWKKLPSPMKSLVKNSQFAAIAFLSCAASVFLPGCASIVNGTKQTVSFNSTPSGAKVYLDGVQVGTTPYVCEVKRGRCPEVVFKKDGFIPEKHKMTDSLDAAPYFGGNLGLCLLWVVPGVVGFIADPITGAMWEYDFPNVNVQLTPEKADAPVKK